MTDRLDPPLDDAADLPPDGPVAAPDPLAPPVDVDRYVRARWQGVDDDSGERIDLGDLRTAVTYAPSPESDAAPLEAVDGDMAAGDTAAGAAAGVPWFERAWRRAVRRPSNWLNSPWPTDRVVKYLLTVLTLAGTTAVMLNVVHLNPLAAKDLVFDDTTPTGGDFGAHVWGPAYLRDHLLPGGWFNGWTMDWYAGMPAYRFYMVLPALMIVAVNTVLPYGVAMKFVSVLGLVTLPFCCWAFGRLGKFRYPIPELFAFGGLCFALDESFSIYGGNLRSTMAGEFSFSIALSFAVLGLGVLSAGLRTGRFRVWAAVLLAAACVSHGIVLIFTVGAALIFSVVWADRQRLWYAFTVGLTTLLLIMWWVGPFLGNHAFMTDMKYGGEPGQGSFDSWWDMFFPLTAPLDFIITTLAVLGFVACIVRRQLNGVALGLTGIALVVGVFLARNSLPVIGLLWNPRLLPFLYLVRYLMMMVGAVEVLTLMWNLVRDRRARAEAGYIAGTAFGATTALVVLVILGWMFQVLPGAKNVTDPDGKTAYQWSLPLPGMADLTVRATDTNAKAAGNGWSRYNFMGYEGRNEYYTEYYGVVQKMAAIGDDPGHGCGRAMWENHEDNGKYGTTMALMLLPFWTDGCIGSMEGLFFEASGTTPYHFLTAAAMSKNSSNPVRELRYTNNDAEMGVPYLQDLGVRYVMLRSSEAQAQADARPELTLIGEAYPWKIYQVAGSDVVVPLTTQPVVVNRRGGDQRERNLELGTSWFQHKAEWAAMPADGGPAEWQRIDVAVDETRREFDGDGQKNRVDVVVPADPIEPVTLDPVAVSNVQMHEQSLSFDVDRTGVPVLVKVSYFPNWKVSGAEGPWRIGPNMMVVVPTSDTVEMSFGRSASDYLTLLLTLIGIGLCVLWRIRGDLTFDSDTPGRLWGPTSRRPALAGADAADPFAADPFGAPVETAVDADAAGHDDASPWRRDDRDPFAGTALAEVEAEPEVVEPWRVAPPRTGPATGTAGPGADQGPPG